MIISNIWLRYTGCQPDVSTQEGLCERIWRLASVLHPRFDARAFAVRVSLDEGFEMESGPSDAIVVTEGLKAEGVELRLRDIRGATRRFPFLFARGLLSVGGQAVVVPGQLISVEERGGHWKRRFEPILPQPPLVQIGCREALDFQFAAGLALLLCYVRRFYMPRLRSSCFDDLPYWALFEDWEAEIRRALRKGPVTLADARGAWRYHVGRGAPGTAPDLPGWFEEGIAQQGTLEATAFGLVAAELAG